MHIKSKLVILTFFFSLLVLSVPLGAQTETNQVAGPTPAEKPVVEQVPTDEQPQVGPRYKNPNAAGRLKKLNKKRSTATTTLPQKRLFGPAYKQRKSFSSSTNPAAKSTPKKPKLTGPRYKNRH